ncbi:hypothetical protein GCM10012280_29780 [Wenjunlia tyrosinilytica]|uniref:Uncharacterized protein n=1 Tax=Wenjunlia tyrosinilytica TaxID=1544741 RepID=A0A918DX21_9ACTN|nr:hypothetical protein GCM10012280_29780 [Wenjunlia tyrosinilytica]
MDNGPEEDERGSAVVTHEREQDLLTRGVIVRPTGGKGMDGRESPGAIPASASPHDSTSSPRPAHWRGSLTIANDSTTATHKAAYSTNITHCRTPHPPPHPT